MRLLSKLPWLRLPFEHTRLKENSRHKRKIDKIINHIQIVNYVSYLRYFILCQVILVIFGIRCVLFWSKFCGMGANDLIHFVSP